MKYKTKPFEVEAVQWHGDNLEEIVKFAETNFNALEEEWRGDDLDATAEVFDSLHNTWVLVYDTNWIIKGSKGEFYPCDDEVFKAKYEPVREVQEGKGN